MNHAFDGSRKNRTEQEIASLFASLLPYYAEELQQYIDEEIEKLSPDHRLRNWQSLFPGGKKTPVAVFVSAARYRAQVRWGDFLLATRERLQNTSMQPV